MPPIDLTQEELEQLYDMPAAQQQAFLASKEQAQASTPKSEPITMTQEEYDLVKGLDPKAQERVMNTVYGDGAPAADVVTPAQIQAEKMKGMNPVSRTLLSGAHQGTKRAVGTFQRAAYGEEAAAQSFRDAQTMGEAHDIASGGSILETAGAGIVSNAPAIAGSIAAGVATGGSSLVAQAVAGGAVSLAMNTPQRLAQAEFEAEQAGLKDDAKYQYVAVQGAIDAGMEATFGAVGARAAAGPVKDAFKELYRRGIVNLGAAEIGTALDMTSKRMMGVKPEEWTYQEIWESALTAGISAVGGQAIGEGVGYVSKKVKRNPSDVKPGGFLSEDQRKALEIQAAKDVDALARKQKREGTEIPSALSVPLSVGDRASVDTAPVFAWQEGPVGKPWRSEIGQAALQFKVNPSDLVALIETTGGKTSLPAMSKDELLLRYVDKWENAPEIASLAHKFSPEQVDELLNSGVTDPVALEKALLDMPEKEKPTGTFSGLSIETTSAMGAADPMNVRLQTLAAASHYSDLLRSYAKHGEDASELASIAYMSSAGEVNTLIKLGLTKPGDIVDAIDANNRAKMAPTVDGDELVQPPLSLRDKYDSLKTNIRERAHRQAQIDGEKRNPIVLETEEVDENEMLFRAKLDAEAVDEERVSRRLAEMAKKRQEEGPALPEMEGLEMDAPPLGRLSEDPINEVGAENPTTPRIFPQETQPEAGDYLGREGDRLRTDTPGFDDQYGVLDEVTSAMLVDRARSGPGGRGFRGEPIPGEGPQNPRDIGEEIPVNGIDIEALTDLPDPALPPPDWRPLDQLRGDRTAAAPITDIPGKPDVAEVNPSGPSRQLEPSTTEGGPEGDQFYNPMELEGESAPTPRVVPDRPIGDPFPQRLPGDPLSVEPAEVPEVPYGDPFTVAPPDGGRSVVAQDAPEAPKSAKLPTTVKAQQRASRAAARPVSKAASDVGLPLPAEGNPIVPPKARNKANGEPAYEATAANMAEIGYQAVQPGQGGPTIEVGGRELTTFVDADGAKVAVDTSIIPVENDGGVVEQLLPVVKKGEQTAQATIVAVRGPEGTDRKKALASATAAMDAAGVTAVAQPEELAKTGNKPPKKKDVAAVTKELEDLGYTEAKKGSNKVMQRPPKRQPAPESAKQEIPVKPKAGPKPKTAVEMEDAVATVDDLVALRKKVMKAFPNAPEDDIEDFLKYYQKPENAAKIGNLVAESDTGFIQSYKLVMSGIKQKARGLPPGATPEQKADYEAYEARQRELGNRPASAEINPQVFDDIQKAFNAGQEFVLDLYEKVRPALERLMGATSDLGQYIASAVTRYGEAIRPYASRLWREATRGGNAGMAFNPFAPGALKKAKAPVWFSRSMAVSSTMRQPMDAANMRQMMKNNGVSDAELKATGLADMTGKITPEQLRLHLESNAVEVREIVLGEKRTELADRLSRLEDERSEVIANIKGSKVENPELRRRLNELDTDIFDMRDQLTESPKFNSRALTTPGGKDYRELVLTLGGPHQWSSESKHWFGAEANKNPLVHVRFNSRTINGKKTLFIEEIQSDFFEKAAAGGFKRGQPFEDNDRWRTLAAQRMMRWAADNGYSQLSFTTGDAQNVRSNKETYISKAIHRDLGDDTFQVTLFNEKKQAFVSEKISLEDLHKRYGGKFARRIKAGEGTDSSSGGKVLEINGKVGGEAMRIRYDEKLRSEFEKLAKAKAQRVTFKNKEAAAVRVSDDPYNFFKPDGTLKKGLDTDYLIMPEDDLYTLRVPGSEEIMYRGETVEEIREFIDQNHMVMDLPPVKGVKSDVEVWAIPLAKELLSNVKVTAYPMYAMINRAGIDESAVRVKARAGKPLSDDEHEVFAGMAADLMHGAENVDDYLRRVQVGIGREARARAQDIWNDVNRGKRESDGSLARAKTLGVILEDRAKGLLTNNTPKTLQLLKEKLDGQLVKYGREAEEHFAAVDKAVRKAFPKAALDEAFGFVDKAMHGLGDSSTLLTRDELIEARAAFLALPKEVQDVVVPARAMLDRLTDLSIEMSIGSKDVVMTRLKNKGVWMKRSYRSFDDPEWLDKQKRGADWDRFAKERQLFELQKARRENPGAPVRKISLEQAKGLNEQTLGAQRDSGSTNYRTATIQGRTDLSVFQQRQAMPKWVREMMGEYGDFRVNYAKSVASMANMVANKEFQDGLLAWGGDSLFSIEKGVQGHDAQIPDAPEYGELAGRYTTPEMRDALQKVNLSEESGPAGQFMGALSAFLRAGKTAWNVPRGLFRQVPGNLKMAYQNGHMGPLGILSPKSIERLSLSGKVALSALTDVRWKDKRVAEAFLHVVDAGLLDSDAVSAITRKQIADAIGGNSKLAKFIRNWEVGSKTLDLAANTSDVMSRIYMSSDNIVKINGFLAEQEMYQFMVDRGEWTPEKLRRHAADKVKDLYPTASRIIPLAARAKNVPIASDFLFFKTERIRNLYHLAKTAMQERQSADPAVRAIGMQRFLSMGAGLVGIPLMTAAVNSFVGDMGLEEHSELRELLGGTPQAYMADKAQIVSRDGDTFTVRDVDFVDSDSLVTSMMMDLTRGNRDWEDNFMAAAVNSLAEFVGGNMALDLLSLVTSGRDRYGNELRGDEYAKAIAKMTAPGILSQVQKGYDVTQGRMSAGDFALYMVGPGTYRYTMEDLVRGSLYRFRNSQTDRRKAYAREKNLYPESAADLAEKQNAYLVADFEELKKRIDAAIKLGAAPELVNKVAEDVKLLKNFYPSVQGGFDPKRHGVE